MPYFKKYITISLVIILLITIDQFTKNYLINLLKADYLHKLEINKFFNLIYVWNHGISFGMFNQFNQIANKIFICCNTIVTLCLIYYLFTTKHKLEILSFMFIISGAVGNLIDRFRYGAVFDFIDIHYKLYHFAIFNIADIYISFGAFLLLSGFYFTKKSNLQL